MSEPTEIRSIKALREWLGTHSGDASKWFACRHPTRSKCLLISDTPWHDFQWDSYSIERRPMYAVELPNVTDARDWWIDFWEREITTYRCSRFHAIVVIAKIGVWNSVPDCHLTRPKDHFVEIDEDVFRDVVGEKVFSDMISEHKLCGLSTRTLDYHGSQQLDEHRRNHG